MNAKVTDVAAEMRLVGGAHGARDSGLTTGIRTSLRYAAITRHDVVGWPPLGKMSLSIFPILKRITVRGSIVGTAPDLEEH